MIFLKPLMCLHTCTCVYTHSRAMYIHAHVPSHFSVHIRDYSVHIHVHVVEFPPYVLCVKSCVHVFIVYTYMHTEYVAAIYDYLHNHVDCNDLLHTHMHTHSCHTRWAWVCGHHPVRSYEDRPLTASSVSVSRTSQLSSMAWLLLLQSSFK